MELLNSILYDTVYHSAPIILCVIGGIFAYKANVLNIALEGMMLNGAFISVLVEYLTGSVALAVIAAIVTTLLWGLVFSFLGITCNGNVIVIGLGINLIVPAIAKFVLKVMELANISLQDVGVADFKINIPGIKSIPLIGGIVSGHPVITYLAFIGIAAAAILMYKTKFGIYVRVVGENEDSAISLGLKTQKYKYIAVLIGAFCCALAGINLSMERSIRRIEIEKGRKIKMMRPMKLAGSELMFGEGSLAYIKTIKAKKVSIVIGGHSMEKSGMLAKVEGYFKETGAETMVIRGVEPDPSFETVLRGRNEMLEFEPDLIVGLGGGSAMDAAKAMWIFYEHPELTQMEDILPPNEFPKLRGKARMCCIPSTSGTASEVSRSIVISDNEKGLKHGVGNMEMMPDIAICDPEVTMSMPAKITAETGMDALTHALEALASNRANYLSDILASQAAQDIMETLPTAYENGNDIKARETMVQASMVAGIAFTNVSLGIVHSMAHTIGGIFHVSHGLADAIILPYIIRYNEQNETAKEVYAKFAKRIGAENLHEAVEALNEKLNIPKCFKEIIPDEEKYMEKLDEMAPLAKADGCTKTNPVIPEIDEFKELFIKVYRGE